MDETKFKLFISEFTKKYPQFSNQEELNYIFAGSFALNCYHYADSEIEIMNKKDEEGFIVQRTAEISDYNKKILEQRIRTAGDIDMILLSKEYEELASRFQINFDISDYKELFSEMQMNYGKEDYKESIKIDVVKLEKDNSTKVKIGDEFYILESPKNLLATKIIYTIRQLQQRIGGEEKTKNSLKDLYCLLQLSTQLYSQEEIQNSFVTEIENVIKLHEREGIALDYFTRNIGLLKDEMRKYCADKLQGVEELLEQAISRYRKKTEIPYQPSYEEK
mgnify:CR=1 FL=1